MKRPETLTLVLSLLFTFLLGGCYSAFSADFSEVAKILGVPGQMQEGAYVLRFPRSDIEVRIDGEAIPTALGFVSWTAWKTMGTESMVMGDLVLLEEEVNPVISILSENDIHITALHNHFAGEQPRIMFMHIHGIGPPSILAQGIRNALEKTKTPKSHLGDGGATQSPLAFDTKRIEQIIGYSGQAGGGVFKITLGRPGVQMMGVELTASMGLNTWAAFVGTKERAHVAGDVAMTAPEVNPIIRALRKGGIDVVAVHNHMLDEEPRIFFLHYWGTGRVEKLAETVRDAFDQTKGPAQKPLFRNRE
jgi:hypothetical protein